MLNAQVIQAIRVFLERTQLNGKEVPVYNAIQAALDAELAPPPIPPAATDKEVSVVTDNASPVA